MKKLLLIMNPLAGTKRANPQLAKIISVFNAGGYEVIVHMTQRRGDGARLAAEYANKVALVVCIGGDGTFNEVISGLYGSKTPIGYIPAGSTNDFASSLKLSKNVVQAAEDIVKGTPKTLDIGQFQDRYFSYVASFGAFTKASYATSQNVKNALGHLAYILSGIKELTALRKWHCKLELDNGKAVEDDYLFGAISNSTSVAGILTLNPDRVDLNDGLFEVLLVKSPANLAELNECIRALKVQDDKSPMLTFCPSSQITVYASPEMDWTLDGEYAKGEAVLQVRNLHNAIQIITKDA